MVRRSTLLVGICCLLLSTIAGEAAAQDPELIVEIEKEEIYEGETVLYRLILNHVTNPTAPQLTGFDDFQVTPLGEQSLNSRQVTIINGRRTQVVRRGRQYDYRLTPLRSGTLTVPAPTAMADNVQLLGREITLRVIPPEDQDVVLLELKSDRSEVYPMQPFELTLTIAVQDLPGDLEGRDPLSVQPQPPILDIPWLVDDQLPDGVEPEQDWRQIMEPLISRRDLGFQVNNIGTSSVFSLFGDRTTRFHPQPQRTTREDRNGEQHGYWEYHFRRTLIPHRLGNYQFGPVTLKGTFADRMQEGRLVGRRIYAVAHGVEVMVRDVPQQGRPETFIGAVGSFEVRAELVPTVARVGDPMTLTVTLSGEGTLADARPPAIDKLPGVQGAFRTYDATQESVGNERRFTYSLRPLNTDVTEFPAIPISFFDVDAEEYVTRRSTTIPVEIRAAETLSESEIVASPSTATTTSEALQLSEGGIFANASDLSVLRNEIVQPSRWLAVWSGMLVSWFAASAAILYVRRIREDPALLRRRGAPGRAKAALAAAATQLDSGSGDATCESLRRAVAGLIADFANVPEEGMTPRDAVERLEALGVEAALREQTAQLLNRCDAARYGAAGDDLTALHAETANLIDQLTAILRKSVGSLRASRRMATNLLLLLGVPLVGCGRSVDLEVSRKFQELEQQFAQATSVEEFARVARQYAQIGGQEFESGAVFYNQGNAWMRAEMAGRAIAAYRQAQRYRPRDPYLLANLENALAFCGQSGPASAHLGVGGYVFFWQNWLSYPEKFVISTLLLASTLVVAVPSQLGKRQALFHRMALVALLLTLLVVASTAWDWHRFDRTAHGVVTAEEVVARKGNSENYQAAFTEPLTEGTEFTVLEERNDWLHVQVGAAGTGWLPRRDVVTY